MLKTIVITWTQQQLQGGQSHRAALWVADGSDFDLNEALNYVHRYHREDNGRVHTFSIDDSDWKRKALAAHAQGHSL